jgi:hypothetical protein
MDPTAYSKLVETLNGPRCLNDMRWIMENGREEYILFPGDKKWIPWLKRDGFQIRESPNRCAACDNFGRSDLCKFEGTFVKFR